MDRHAPRPSQGEAVHAQRPDVFVDGRRKPFMFHSNTWADEVACMPGCRVLAFDTGHWVMVAAPEAFNDAVVDWLAATDTVH